MLKNKVYSELLPNLDIFLKYMIGIQVKCPDKVIQGMESVKYYRFYGVHSSNTAE